jgi:signal transduction histidine kinase
LLAYQRPVARTLHALLSGIAAASAIGLAFALLLGILVVRRSLRPLSTMAAAVAAIEATGDLSRRVGLRGRNDEVGRLARTFDRMLAKLEDTFQRQRRFLADASHELRTPLTVARGQLELVANQLEPGTGAAPLSVATEELDRMAHIVDDLLLLARLDEGLQLRREPVEVELVLREALLRALLLARRETRVQTEPDLYVLADSERLLQVLTNLVTNAITHTDEHGYLVLAAERHGDQAVIRVCDDGCGIPPDELPRVFERFYRGARERAAAPEGSGLGLAIAHSLLTAMNGTIEACSAPARGTTFTIRLPIAHTQTPARHSDHPLAHRGNDGRFGQNAREASTGYEPAATSDSDPLPPGASAGELFGSGCEL